MQKLDPIEVRDILDEIQRLRSKLKGDVLRSVKTTSEIGEWFVENMLPGSKRCPNPVQKGHDLELGSSKIQVKTHAKGMGNNTRWTTFKYTEKEFDQFIILVFTEDYYLLEGYDLSFEQAISHVNNGTLKWNDCKDFKMKRDQIPEKLSPFLSPEFE